MNMKRYSESVGKPPGHEIVLRCSEEHRDHPWLLYRAEMYRKLHPDRKVVIRTIKRVEQHEPEKELS